MTALSDLIMMFFLLPYGLYYSTYVISFYVPPVVMLSHLTKLAMLCGMHLLSRVLIVVVILNCVLCFTRPQGRRDCRRSAVSGSIGFGQLRPRISKELGGTASRP
mgnify:CR=1 FL=1